MANNLTKTIFMARNVPFLLGVGLVRSHHTDRWCTKCYYQQGNQRMCDGRTVTRIKSFPALHPINFPSCIQNNWATPGFKRLVYRTWNLNERTTRLTRQLQVMASNTTYQQLGTYTLIYYNRLNISKICQSDVKTGSLHPPYPAPTDSLHSILPYVLPINV